MNNGKYHINPNQSRVLAIQPTSINGMESYRIKEERNTTANEQLEITPFINGKGTKQKITPPLTNHEKDEDELL